ncbi:aminoglycoside phosphotransferase family protein [Streptomyces sp. SID13031]|uniref:phosphotransferase family protein n=1 Tax=Streptomyces sp. SID13031 TaxID=2706046 RepID=UPI0013CCFBD1|nr:aminoglycoside phosphotransferase family protein [Streptomyces sp. SID13031]NEA31932.1 aminoglycoside phosphotransferase family protein [Streptomyces sp. SID13031]
MKTPLRDALATRYDVPADAIREVPGGVANRAYALGDDLFVRIPRSGAFEKDLLKEAAVIPVARAAGVRTPAIVDLDTTRALVDAPYMILERVHGTDLVDTDEPGPAFWQEVGSQVTLLHQVDQPPHGVAPDDGGGAPDVEQLAADGYLDPGTANWLRSCLDHLATLIPRDQRVLLHGDLAQQNLMAQGNHLEALIDWGDAAWGPPGMEFAKLRLEHVVAVLANYPHHEGLEASILWFHLCWGLSNLAKGPQPSQRHWTAPPTSRLLGVLRFYASSPPAPWPDLLEKPSKKPSKKAQY